METKEEFVFKKLKMGDKKSRRKVDEAAVFEEEEFVFKTVSEKKPRKTTKKKNKKNVLEFSSIICEEIPVNQAIKEIKCDEVDLNGLYDGVTEINSLIQAALREINTKTRGSKAIEEYAKQCKFIAFKNRADPGYVESKREEYEREIAKWNRIRDEMMKKCLIKEELLKMPKRTEIDFRQLEKGNEDQKAEFEANALRMQIAEDNLLFRMNQINKKANQLIRNVFDETEEKEMNPVLILKALTKIA
ncbi:hypothetical protein ECANGB1_929 [Enterospora canceri]|uniref:Uncharacterized protein n=1 Tax=Enterospora canceri TaxID=1081671 RepID=A0A1Y1S742_9MICR|nr:hypothetical protein ECANGB1_929 [Enterospora canceri]